MGSTRSMKSASQPHPPGPIRSFAATPPACSQPAGALPGSPSPKSRQAYLKVSACAQAGPALVDPARHRPAQPTQPPADTPKVREELKAGLTSSGSGSCSGNHGSSSGSSYGGSSSRGGGNGSSTGVTCTATISSGSSSAYRSGDTSRSGKGSFLSPLSVALASGSLTTTRSALISPSSASPGSATSQWARPPPCPRPHPWPEHSRTWTVHAFISGDG